MTSMIRVQLLGPVRASNVNGPIALRGKTARTVLARLALSTGSIVSIDQLVDALWDDDPPLEPSVSIRSIVSRLRTQLGSATIITDGAGYRLDITLVSVDLAELEAGMRNKDLASLDPARLAASLDLWDGDALTDVAWTPAFEPERARIAELQARLVDCYHEAMLRSGRAEQTLADLERDAGAAPLRESTQLLLMRVLDACGRTADALRSGDAYRRGLVDQTGLNPTQNFETTLRSLLTEDERPDLSSDDTSAQSRFPLRMKPSMIERRPGEPIAYATIGSGPPLVFMPGWISSLDAFADGSDPRSALLARLADDFSVTVFDRYGTGLSAATGVDTSLGGSADEVRAIIDLVDDHPTLFASSAAGPAALLASGGNPAVGRLVLMCTYANGPALFTNPQNNTNMINLVEQSWGTGSRIIADMVVPGIDAFTRSVFARFQRRTATPAVASGYIRQIFEADVTSVLPQIEQPCLIMHYRNDSAIPYNGSRQLALGINNTELIPLDGPYHTPPPDHIDQLAATILEFTQRG